MQLTKTLLRWPSGYCHLVNWTQCLDNDSHQCKRLGDDGHRWQFVHVTLFINHSFYAMENNTQSEDIIISLVHLDVYALSIMVIKAMQASNYIIL